MRSVFLSFLGKGGFKGKDKYGEPVFDYDPVVYEYNDKKSILTKFVQVAEIEMSGAQLFDKIIIVTTEASERKHFESLKSQLSDIGVRKEKIFNISINEDMKPEYPFTGVNPHP